MKSSHRLKPLALRLLCAALALSTVACSTIDPVSGKKVMNMYSIDEDIQLGQQTLRANTEEMQKSNVPIDQDPKRVAQLQEMVNRLAAVSDLPQLPYSVTLYHTNIVNAAAAPGGSMMVFEGLWDKKEGLVDPNDESELAAVMAHEIAHVNCRHTTEKITKVTIGATAAEIGAVIASANDQDGLAWGIRGAFAAGTALWIPSYSRKDEAEADRVGIFYMAKAGYDPRGAVRIWKKASEQEGSKDKASIFATHPADKQRYEALVKMLPYAMDEYATVTGSYPRDYHPDEFPRVYGENFDWRRPPK